LDSETGFTLIELLIASLIAGIVSTLTWNILIQNAKSDARTEFRRRLHQDWQQATSLIQSEIALSDVIRTQSLSQEDVVDTGCELLQDQSARLKLKMHLLGTLPEIIYGVRKISSLPVDYSKTLLGGPDAGVLIRCGPRMTISDEGRIEYIQGNYQQSIVLDNLDLSENDGLDILERIVSPGGRTSQKFVDFSLSMIDNSNESNDRQIRTKTFNSGGVSRINEVPPIPSDQSVCEAICQTKDVDCGNNVVTLLKADDSFYVAGGREEPAFGTETICTNRPYSYSQGIQGSNGNYVLDGNPTPSRNNPSRVTLIGGKQGRNILLGSPADDFMMGGEKHDALIGRGGNDQLDGNDGNDSFLPWSNTSQQNGSTISINGGKGFDRVYLKGNQNTYQLAGDCDDKTCEVRLSTGNKIILNLTSVEQIIFNNGIKNLI
jgi:prepilin-type N-terminal cleavage/methylation domain-containing protein